MDECEDRAMERDDRPTAGAADANPALGAVKVDWKLFEHHLGDADLTDDEKREFIEALWYIVMTFVDLGFGIEPVQHAILAGQKTSSELARPTEASKTDSGLADEFRSARKALSHHHKKEKFQEGKQT